jgi:hypothetical protein
MSYYRDKKVVGVFCALRAPLQWTNEVNVDNIKVVVMWLHNVELQQDI